MPGPILHQGAVVTCAHGGVAQPIVTNPRVRVSGQMIVTLSGAYSIAGCPFNISGGPSPCVTANWVIGAVRVTANGVPVVLQTSQAICAPNGTPLLIMTVQPRVVAT